MRAFLVALLLLGAMSPAVANAASVAYIDNGEVWLSSLDGAQKVKLTGHVVNSNGATEKWLDVAQSDNGRIVAVRNEPGKTARLSWFKVWEPNGTSTVEGPLNAPNGWFIYAYPVGFDITADGNHLVYGYSNSSLCCPINFAHGTYVRPATNSVLDPISLSGVEWPTLFGNRVIAASGSTVTVQDPGTTYGNDFTPWLDTSGVGLDLRRTDVAANGQFAALEFEKWNGGTQTDGAIALIGINGVDANPTFSVDCSIPATGVANEVSLSQDAKFVAWKDVAGVKVAGTPNPGPADPCVMTSAPVVISAGGSHPAIGCANVSAFLPPAPPTGGGGNNPPTGGGGGGGTTTPAAPTLSVPAKVKLAASGLSVKAAVSGAGKVTLTATVPAKAMGKKGKPVKIGTGSANATKAGAVTIKLKLTAAAKKRLKKLKGTKLTLKITQNGRSTTKTVKLG